MRDYLLAEVATSASISPQWLGPHVWARTSSPATPEDILAAVDAAVEGRCAGPGCGQLLTERSASAYFCGQTCQELWSRRQTDRPEQVRGSVTVAQDAARWRPDLVDAFDDFDLELMDELTERDRIRRWYRHVDGRRFLRLDDGHRWVGAFAPDDEEGSADLWQRLERELTDPRRLDPDLAPATDEPTQAFGASLDEISTMITSFGQRVREALQVIAGAMQADEDRQALRTVCADEAMYQRALAEAQASGQSVRQMFEAVVCGGYTESGWVLRPWPCEGADPATVERLVGPREMGDGS